MSIDCYRQLAAALKEGPVVLATVTDVKGSVPREVGAKMIVCADDRTFNTIGGGAGEAKVIRQAMQVLKTGEKQFVEIDLSGAPHREIQGVCGGRMQVWLERWSGESAIALVRQILDLLESGESGALVTPFDRTLNPYVQLSPSDVAAVPKITTTAFIEPLIPPPRLLIVGGGHVGVALAQVAHIAGFQIAVQDDRPEFASAERFPAGSKMLPMAIANALLELPLTGQLYVALVTRGYQNDLEALEALLRLSQTNPPRYIGMIGSEKRVRMVFQTLQQRGISPDLFKDIYAPIGLAIGALTPEEIAVSICAELIQVRRGGTGRSLCDRIRP